MIVFVCVTFEFACCLSKKDWTGRKINLNPKNWYVWMPLYKKTIDVLVVYDPGGPGYIDRLEAVGEFSVHLHIHRKSLFQ